VSFPVWLMIDLFFSFKVPDYHEVHEEIQDNF